ncbi:MAG: hypothetical protein LLF75_13300 [Eubacteriales bacterium]|nr:hypothetical protein [Eubacteriales bacterium]
MICVVIHCDVPAKRNLYTYQNRKKSRFVDNMVDNVDKGWWITHAAFVYTVGCKRFFTHGKRLFFDGFLQEILPEKREEIPLFPGIAGSSNGNKFDKQAGIRAFLQVPCRFRPKALPSLWQNCDSADIL